MIFQIPGAASTKRSTTTCSLLNSWDSPNRTSTVDLSAENRNDLLSPFTADNNYNFDSVALPRLMRVIASMPQVDVRSFYVGTLSETKALPSP